MEIDTRDPPFWHLVGSWAGFNIRTSGPYRLSRWHGASFCAKSAKSVVATHRDSQTCIMFVIETAIIILFGVNCLCCTVVNTCWCFASSGVFLSVLFSIYIATSHRGALGVLNFDSVWSLLVLFHSSLLSHAAPGLWLCRMPFLCLTYSINSSREVMIMCRERGSTVESRPPPPRRKCTHGHGY
jgi:hypothetical protein